VPTTRPGERIAEPVKVTLYNDAGCPWSRVQRRGLPVESLNTPKVAASFLATGVRVGSPGAQMSQQGQRESDAATAPN
jgi:hypothetical protein